MKDGLGNDLKPGDLVTAQLPSENIVCRIAQIQQGFIVLELHIPADDDGSFGRLLALREPGAIKLIN